MFNKGSSRCKMLDWQFTATGSIFLDFGTMAFISMSPVATAAHLDRLTTAYYDEFSSVCGSLGVPGSRLPWPKADDFSKEAREKGLHLAFLWCSTSYELVAKYPKLKERVHWVLQESVKLTPHLYK